MQWQRHLARHQRGTRDPTHVRKSANSQTELEQKPSRSQKSHKIPHNSRRLPSYELKFPLCLSECHALSLNSSKLVLTISIRAHQSNQSNQAAVLRNTKPLTSLRTMFRRTTYAKGLDGLGIALCLGPCWVYRRRCMLIPVPAASARWII